MRLTLLLLSCVWLALVVGCKKDAPKVAPQEKPSSQRMYPLSSLKTAKVKIGKNEWTVWIMDDEKKREEGLMYVKPDELPEGKGMLFVFQDSRKLSFWMENTEVGLDIAFFNSDRKLLNVQRGVPFDETSLPSEGPAKYVLEVRDGTFEKLGIKRGAQLELLK